MIKLKSLSKVYNNNNNKKKKQKQKQKRLEFFNILNCAL